MKALKAIDLLSSFDLNGYTVCIKQLGKRYKSVTDGVNSIEDLDKNCLEP